ncbi:hypothetical protein T4D_7036 [Trichinella pseudospiralis]|uniref:Retrovirus-related Pol polyprotein from transposon TNT 1-94 n=1 Tax=Trichinella pseudospiralis TaxID=6337 RepID=A0A0V1F5C6_TRIPS|nr:hypothetical protein T4D_14776 [Trichinella pseudospiralis]KRY81271.1 hypothetical protein T4D_12826 [Trichinella pseudospiralis]KRY81767.1 hypothetical protein T4D_16800 [Trichinella pseudospiralis]KRY82095.1 hypothetical protein T4D_7036 [Trichinella pseudospiralis]
MALRHAAQETAWLRSLQSELEKESSKPTLLCDNSGARDNVSISTGQSSSARTRHIDIRYHFVKLTCHEGPDTEPSGSLCETNWDGNVKWECWKSHRHPLIPNYQCDGLISDCF